jgi:hypothetical protein
VLSLGHELVIILRGYCEAAEVFIASAAIAEVLRLEDSCLVLALARHFDEGSSADSTNVELVVVDARLIYVAFAVDGDDAGFAWQALRQAGMLVEVNRAGSKVNVGVVFF